MKAEEGEFVVMKHNYTHTNKKGMLGKVTGLHLKSVSLEFGDGETGSYPWNDVEKSEPKQHCICPHCSKVNSPIWNHEGPYYECGECDMAFKEKDYDIKWSKFY